MSFKQQLIEMNACYDAVYWVENRTIQQAWNDCPRGDWMLWLLETMKEVEGWPDEEKIMLLGHWCARRAWKYTPMKRTRPPKTDRAKEAWARGEITKEEIAVALAYSWTAAAHAAKSVAKGAAFGIARATAFNKETSIQANYIRTQFTPPKGDLCLSNNNW